MGIIHKISQLHQRLSGPKLSKSQQANATARTCRFETMEPRRMMAADLHLGAVYFEEASGDDSQPDVIEVTFEGGVPGTQLTKLVISGDKAIDGLSLADVFFDIEGGNGSFGHSPLKILSQEGFEIVGVELVDGGTDLVFHFSGFDAGEKLKFSIDVDEVSYLDPATGAVDANSVAEGAEFQRSWLTGTFKAQHFENKVLSTQFWDFYDQRFAAAAAAAGSTLDLPQDTYVATADLSDRTAGAVVTGKQVAIPASISGHVYHDRNNDGVRDEGEEGIGGVKIRVQAISTADGSTGVWTVQTDADGFWSVDGLVAGTYRVVEVEQPASYFDGIDTPGKVNGATRGTTGANEELTGIVLGGGEDGVEFNFGELKGGSIKGRVHADPEGDCTFGPNDVPLENVKIDLRDANGNVLRSTYTNSQGYYEFTDLRPGTYQIFEHQPTGYAQGGTKVGSAGGVRGTDLVTEINIGSDVHGVDYNFCENYFVGISGHVYHDRDNDGTRDAGEEGIAGVVMRLLDANGNFTGKTATTNADGFYEFTGLIEGTYGVEEVHPPTWLDGIDTPGNSGGTAQNPGDRMMGIVLTFGHDAENYNFGELLPGSIRGRVIADENRNCQLDEGELPLGGVRVELYDKDGNFIRFTTTDSNGYYEFTGLELGTYQVKEIQPQGYFHQAEHIGSGGGVKLGQDHIGNIVIGSDAHLVDYNFCEMPPGSIAGRVIADKNGNCQLDPGEIPLAGVRIELYDKDGNFIRFTTTDADGRYEFTDLRPDEYRVKEIQPEGYFHQAEHIGSGGGVKLAQDYIGEIEVNPGADLVNYNFCEMPPGSIRGRVIADENANCVLDPGEKPLGGVRIELYDKDGNFIRFTTTNDEGFYEFTGLKPGEYRVKEIQPEGYFHQAEHIGSGGGVKLAQDYIGQIDVNPGADLVDYNFCEAPPGSIRGRVIADKNGNCQLDPGESPLGGVKIELLDANGNVVAVTTTNSQGRYEFTQLRPGVYAVREIQPTGYFHQAQKIGSGGGVIVAQDWVGEIHVGGGQDLVDYNFCEIPPSKISGYVFQDGSPITTPNGQPPSDLSGIKDGRRDAGDKPLAGVVLELRHGVTGEPILGNHGLPGVYAAGPIRVTTDENGYYQFVGLPPGTYAVFEVHPEGYSDGIDTSGTLGGLAVNASDPLDPLTLSQLGENDPANDAILRIPLGAGTHSQENNFSEVIVVAPPKPPIPWISPTPDPLPTLSQLPGGLPENPLFIQPPSPLRPIPRFLPNGGGKVIGYTWHLSVINSGQPRSVEKTDALVYMTSQQFDSRAWKGRDLDQSGFTLGMEEGTDASKRRMVSSLPHDELLDSDLAEHRRHLIFGAPDGIPFSGDFNGDGTSEVGVFIKGEWFIDINGNGVWDDGDLWAKLGHDGDLPIAGDWDGDGKDDIGIYGPAWPGDPRAIQREPGLPDPQNQSAPREGRRSKNMPPNVAEAALGTRTMKLTAQGTVRADVIDHVFHYGAPGDRPVSGDWNGNGIKTIGVFRKGEWHLDIDGDGEFTDKDLALQFGEAGDIPIVGDWTGDGIDKIGVYRAGKWILDTNNNRELDALDQVFEMGDERDMPVVGDWRGTGIDEPGLYHMHGPDEGHGH